MTLGATLGATRCQCGHRLTKMEIVDDVKVYARRNSERVLRIRYQCSACGKLGYRDVQPQDYKGVISAEMTFRDLFNVACDTLFLCENSPAEQRVFENYMGKSPIDIHEVIQFCQYLQICTHPMQDLAEIQSWYRRQVSSTSLTTASSADSSINSPTD